MTKAIAVAVLGVCLSFVAGIAVADKVRDWQDLEAAHNHVQEAIYEMDRARGANHYDMAGHGAKAEEHLRAAERELHEAIEAAKAAR
jgi:Na+/glutamate symporter